MISISPVRISLANQDVAALLADLEEVVAINELAGCGCGCGCGCASETGIDGEGYSTPGVSEAEVAGLAAEIGMSPEQTEAMIETAVFDNYSMMTPVFNGWTLDSFQDFGTTRTCVYTEFGTNRIGTAVVDSFTPCPSTPTQIF